MKIDFIECRRGRKCQGIFRAGGPAPGPCFRAFRKNQTMMGLRAEPRGTISFSRIMPARNPPMWAHHATPPVRADVWPIVAAPLRNWRRNQIPRKKKAGISTTGKKKNSGTSVSIRAFGKRRKDAPTTPAIAPDAPMLGTMEFDWNAIWARKEKAPHAR